MSNKKKNNRPSNIGTPAGVARKTGSPVEAARKSFVPVDQATEIASETPVRAASGSGKGPNQNASSRRQAQLERKRKRERRQLLTGIAIALGILVVVGGIIAWALTQTPRSAIAGVQTFSGLEQTHVTGTVSYPQLPPVGGAHSPIWQNCGIYDQPVVSENGVHSLEHGAVWVTYQPNLPQAAVEQLRVQARGKGYVLLSPFTGLTSPVVASAWGTQLKLEDAADPRLAEFIKTYAQGPQTPEPGASCTGGVGTPSER
ncbi:MAG: hypothetical protein JWP00_4682 [Chloroflexi bacterium]|jgi:hypothetical protein|nr:hypothetical protein [Chloroflexota bacterium]